VKFPIFGEMNMLREFGKREFARLSEEGYVCVVKLVDFTPGVFNVVLQLYPFKFRVDARGFLQSVDNPKDSSIWSIDEDLYELAQGVDLVEAYINFPQ
jgi:hypothetical protein